MKIAFVHYNVGHRDGVNTVMRTNALSILERYKDSKIVFVGSVVRHLIEGYKTRVRHVDIPEMDILGKGKRARFSSKDVFDYMRNGMEIYFKLKKALKGVDFVVIENPNIGVNPAVTYAYYRLVKRTHQRGMKRRALYRIHDFAEDRRGNFINLLKFKGTESSPYWHKVIFPRVGHLSFAVINKKDLLRLHSHGLIEENRAHYLPNPINDKLYYEDKETSMKLRDLLIKKYRLDKDSKFIFYPVRIVTRKNVEEAIFLTQLLNKKFDGKYVLVVSLRPKLTLGLKYYRALNKFVKKHKLPVILGINEHVSMERALTKSGRVKMFGVGDMYNICDKVISTSTLEGFGMFFIESWFFNKSIIGRDLPEITTDFKSAGINLENLYDALFIDGKDFKDYGTISQRLKLVHKLKNKKFFENFEKENQHTLSGLYRMFDPQVEKPLIKDNKKIVLRDYCTGSVTKQIMHILRTIPREAVIKK
ncbi:hypothetical protein KY332_04950 [Candidatus Woesearchaeota archaeon]|nr:hypothetical protein [Candidatus Woesearchaeota archaeon]